MFLNVIYCKLYKHSIWANCGKWSVGEARRSFVGSRKVFSFCISIGKLDRDKGIFPSETCEKLVVRGTISFCNNKITILPVGENAVGNIQMWWNEQCWRGTISFQQCFINCDIILTFWTYVLVWMFSGLFCDNFHYE